MKKGRFSWKKDSTSLRFTTAGSTSTCPKSGFTVASRVRFDPRPIFRSAPIAPLFLWPWLKGSPGTASNECDFTVAVR